MKKSLTLDEYRTACYDIIRQRIGGSPSFVPNEDCLSLCYDKGYSPDVPADCAIDDAIAHVKQEAELFAVRWVTCKE